MARWDWDYINGILTYRPLNVSAPVYVRLEQEGLALLLQPGVREQVPHSPYFEGWWGLDPDHPAAQLFTEKMRRWGATVSPDGRITDTPPHFMLAFRRRHRRLQQFYENPPTSWTLLWEFDAEKHAKTFLRETAPRYTDVLNFRLVGSAVYVQAIHRSRRVQEPVLRFSL
jgi:hypothetical protein